MAKRRRWHRIIRLEFLEKVENELQRIVNLAGLPSLGDLSQELRVPSGGGLIGDLANRIANPTPVDSGAITTSATLGDLVRRGLIFEQPPTYQTKLIMQLPKPYIELDGEAGNSEKGNTAEIRIWNLDDDTLKKIRVADIVLVKIGYRDAPPLQGLFNATIDKIHTETQTGQKLTTMTITDSGQEWMTRQAWYTAPPGVNGETALRDLLLQFAVSLDTKVGISVKHIELPVNVVYPQGLHFMTKMTVRQAIERILDDAGAKSYVINGELYIQPREPGARPLDIVVSKDSWHRMLGRPERIEQEDNQNADDAQWSIAVMMDGVFKPGITFRVFSEEINALVEAVECTYIANKQDFKVQMKVQVVRDFNSDIDPETHREGIIEGGTIGPGIISVEGPTGNIPN